MLSRLSPRCSSCLLSWLMWRLSWVTPLGWLLGRARSPVRSSTWSSPGIFEVRSIADGTNATIRNLEDAATGAYPGNAAPVPPLNIPSGARVSPGGLQGTDGESGVPLTTRGDLLTRDAANNVRLAIGPAGRVVRSDGTDPQWAQVALATDVTGQTADCERRHSGELSGDSEDESRAGHWHGCAGLHCAARGGGGVDADGGEIS
jgi:hypothetical protein